MDQNKKMEFLRGRIPENIKGMFQQDSSLYYSAAGIILLVFSGMIVLYSIYSFVNFYYNINIINKEELTNVAEEIVKRQKLKTASTCYSYKISNARSSMVENKEMETWQEKKIRLRMEYASEYKGELTKAQKSVQGIIESVDIYVVYLDRWGNVIYNGADCISQKLIIKIVPSQKGMEKMPYFVYELERQPGQDKNVERWHRFSIADKGFPSGWNNGN